MWLGDGSPALATGDMTGDYQAVRGAAMALAVIAFLIAVTKLSTSDLPHERPKAQGLLITSLLIFGFLAGDRMIVQGLAGWFGISTTSLPTFWQ